MRICALVITSWLSGLVVVGLFYLIFGSSGLLISVPVNVVVGGILGWLWPRPHRKPYHLDVWRDEYDGKLLMCEHWNYLSAKRRDEW